jgi:hypothetical protein
MRGCRTRARWARRPFCGNGIAGRAGALCWHAGRNRSGISGGELRLHDQIAWPDCPHARRISAIRGRSTSILLVCHRCRIGSWSHVIGRHGATPLTSPRSRRRGCIPVACLSHRVGCETSEEGGAAPAAPAVTRLTIAARMNVERFLACAMEIPNEVHYSRSYITPTRYKQQPREVLASIAPGRSGWSYRGQPMC